ncbi:MAG TPA: GntR family transcriptional regulator [Vicinamibacterales bacterium]|nr:GntR family transcriptional regulator [Vicinamibacterales bacterium]
MLSGFVLSQADGRPMYLQIIEQVRRRIAVGDWKAGELLPSIRQLAADLQVSVITVKRAYLELEREGLILTHHGKGSVVAARTDAATQVYEQELTTHLEQAAHLAGVLGISTREVQARLRDAIEQTKPAAVKP